MELLFTSPLPTLECNLPESRDLLFTAVFSTPRTQPFDSMKIQILPLFTHRNEMTIRFYRRLHPFPKYSTCIIALHTAFQILSILFLNLYIAPCSQQLFDAGSAFHHSLPFLHSSVGPASSGSDSCSVFPPCIHLNSRVFTFNSDIQLLPTN